MNQHGMTDMGRLDLDKMTGAQPEPLNVVACGRCDGSGKIAVDTKQPEPSQVWLTMSFDEFREMEDDLAALREADKQKTHEINVLTPENRDLTAKCERLEKWSRAWKETARLYKHEMCDREYNALQARLEAEAKCERLSDNLLIRTRELEDRTAELERSKEEIAYNELRWMEHMTLIRNDLKAHLDKAVAALKEVLSALPLESRLRIRAMVLEAAPEISKNPSEAAIKAALAAQCIEADMTEALRMFKSLCAAYAIDYPIREGERDVTPKD